MSTNKNLSNSGDNPRYRCKGILRRTSKFQNYFTELRLVIANFTSKSASLRDRNDDIAKCLSSFTDVEEISTTSKLAMAVTAELIASVGDYQDMAVQRMETLVLPNISSYNIICDSVKADLLNAIQGIKRENETKKTLNVLRKKSRSSSDTKLKKAAEEALRECERSSAEATRLCQLSQEHIVKFEHKRLMDLKESLGNFIKIQISTHAKSLELLSQAYKHIQSIDEEADLDILKPGLKIGEYEYKEKKKSSLKKGSKVKSQKSFPSPSHSKQKKSVVQWDLDSESESKSKSEYDADKSYSAEIRRLENALHTRKMNKLYS